MSGMRLIIAGIIQDEAYFREQVKPYLDDQKILYIGPVDVSGKERTVCPRPSSTTPEHHPRAVRTCFDRSQCRGRARHPMNLGSCREVIKDGQTGFLVDNVTEAVRSLGRISEIDGRACRNRVQQYFSIDTMVEGYERVYSMIFDLEAKR